MPPHRTALALGLVALLPACSLLPGGAQPTAATAAAGQYAGATPEMMRLVEEYAAFHGIPEELLHRVIQRESGYNPAARNGPYFGLLQILPQTARTMGYEGPDAGLLDAETNLRWAGAYLRGAWIVADGDMDEAVDWYARGYYYEARDRSLLVETGLRDSELR